jgi:[protein-PII] uridylyltransferase
VSYFARHDAADIAWHARSLWRHVRREVPIVRARPSSVGDGLQVLVYCPDRPDLFARICGYFDSAGFSILDAKHPHHAHRLCARHLPGRGHAGHAPDTPGGYRDLISLVETQAALALASDGPLPEPRSGRVSRRVRSFPVTPRVSLAPDERAQRWLLTVSASDRSGLLYAIARVLARNRHQPAAGQDHHAGRARGRHLPGRRPGAAAPKAQLRIESELLDAVAAGRMPP